jgi:zinc protease
MRQLSSRPGVALALTILALAPLAAQTAQTDSSKLPPAREVIDRHIREIGGREAILKQTSTHAVGTVSLPAAGLTGQMEAFHAKPNKFLQRMTLPGIGVVEEGFDGTIGWSVSPLTGPSLLEGKQLEQRQFDADFFEELKAPDRYQSMTTVEKTTFDEQPAYKIRLVKRSGEEDIEFYETQTGLKIGTVTTRESPMGPMQGTTSYTDYKQFGPLRQPTTMKLSLMSTQMVMSIVKLEYGTVDPWVFALPAQIKALLK